MTTTYIETVTTADSGGGSMNDIVQLKSGMILLINDDAVCCYTDRDYQMNLEPLWCVASYDTDAPEMVTDQGTGQSSKVMRFKVVFDDTYVNPDTVEVGTTWFSDENGYSAAECGQVVMLNVGEVVTLDEGHQTIERVL